MEFTFIKIKKQRYRLRKWKLTEKGEDLLVKIVGYTIVTLFIALLMFIGSIDDIMIR